MTAKKTLHEICVTEHRDSRDKLLDTAAQQSGAKPDIVFTAHVHNYQRFTRKIDGQDFDYVAAGAGGY